MTTTNDIDKQIAELKLKKKNILNERNKQTPTKQNDDLFHTVFKWNRDCKNNETIAKTGEKKGWLNKKIWSHTTVSPVYCRSEHNKNAFNYRDAIKFHQNKANEDDTVIKCKYYMTTTIEVEMEFYPKWKCPVCYMTHAELCELQLSDCCEELKCGHIFCTSCIDNLNHPPKCPLCRKDFIRSQTKEVSKKVM